MILGPDGKEIRTPMSEEQVAQRLRDIAPKTAAERELLVKKVGEMVEAQRQNKVIKGLDHHGFDKIFKENADRRAHTDGFTKDRHMRVVAQMPGEMEFIIREQYGNDWYKDIGLVKKLLTEDEFGRMCLTVDPETI